MIIVLIRIINKADLCYRINIQYSNFLTAVILNTLAKGARFHYFPDESSHNSISSIEEYVRRHDNRSNANT